MTISKRASSHAEGASPPSPTPPAPWMPLGPLTELWAAFGKEATSREALLAASCAFAALAEERGALHNLNWLAPVWPQAALSTSAAADPASFSLFVTQEAVIEALNRAAPHWYEAACALVEQVGQPLTSERDEQAESPALELEALIGYTLSQRLRVWAIVHSLLSEQMQRLFPTSEPQGGQAR